MSKIEENKIPREVYLDDGSVAMLVGQSDNTFFVKKVMVFEDPHTGGHFDQESETITQVYRIYNKPPVEKFSEKVVELTEEVSKLQGEVRSAREERNEMSTEIEAMHSRAKLNDQLKYIFDFLDQKVTHIVKNSWSGVQVMTLEECIDNDDNWRDSKRLVSLFGDSKGNLDWRVNRYSDGSGSDDGFYPCISLEEANKRAKAALDEKAKAIRTDDKAGHDRFKHLLDSYGRIGEKAPAWLKTKYVQAQKKDIKNSIEHYRKYVSEYEDELAKLSKEGYVYIPEEK